MLIDLTVPLNEQTPVYPGDPKTTIKPAGILEEHGYQDHLVSVGTHVGTHIDAPAHMIKGGKTLDEIDIVKFFGNGVLIKTGKEINLDKVKRVAINKGDIVLFFTGMSNIFHKEEYYTNSPTIPENVADYLIAKKIKIVGLDMSSPDHEPFPIHKKLLAQEILIIENLTNLALLENKKFKVYAFPLKLEVDGAPARVIAEIIQ